ncbi:MAG: MMPL family transporter, partial [Planctomycetales bacterium]
VKSVVSLQSTPGNLSINSPLARPFLKVLEGFLVSKDHRTAATVCMLVPEAAAEEQGIHRADVVAEIRRVSLQAVPGAVVAGEPVMVVDGFAALEEDGRRLAWWTTSLLVLVILVLFRSPRWVLIPLAVVQAALIWTTASLVLCRFQLSMVSSMLTAIVTVIGVATVIHLTVRYRQARERELPPDQAFLVAGGLVAGPIFWACCTDAAGFAALTASRVGPVSSFGVMMAVGALFTCLAVALIVPFAALAGRFDRDPRRAWGESGLDAALQGLSHSLQRRPTLLMLAVVALVALCVSGHPRLEIETDFTKNFRAGSPIVTSYEFVEQRLGGTGVWDVYLKAPEKLNQEYLDRAWELEEALRAIRVPGPDGKPTPGITKAVSLADVVRAADEAGGSVARWVPLSAKIALLKRQSPELVNSMHGRDPEENGQAYFRVMLRSREQQSAENKRLVISEALRISREKFPEGAHATGFFVLLANLVHSLLADQWTTFLVAVAGVGLMMMLAFLDWASLFAFLSNPSQGFPTLAHHVVRGAALSGAAIIPNALPIVMVLGLMGHLGLKINMGTVMIAAVSMGLSVDSSIHYLTTFLRSLDAGDSFGEAIDAVHQTVGRAMVFSTIALMVGFSALCASEFVPTIYFGALVSLSMLGGLAGNLILLPLLLNMLHGLQRRFRLSESNEVADNEETPEREDAADDAETPEREAAADAH